jgi:hypothetical protein
VDCVTFVVQNDMKQDRGSKEMGGAAFVGIISFALD